jgi:hypothetical protein
MFNIVQIRTVAGNILPQFSVEEEAAGFSETLPQYTPHSVGRRQANLHSRYRATHRSNTKCS